MDKAELRDRLKPWLLAVAAALPFQLLYLIDAIVYGNRATGFVMMELPYYAANGRAYFEAGNGLLHPNPYDPNSPNIYFQLSTWIIGAFNKVTSIDPGVGMAVLGVLFSILMARATYSLVAARLSENRYQTLIYFLVMFAGGLFTMRSVIEMLLGIAPTLITNDGMLSLYEPSYGWWTLSWGRNMILTTEAMYHWLMALTWLAFLRDQWKLAAGLTLIILISHPWTGVVALAVFGAWMATKWIVTKERPDLIAALMVFVGAACFGWYYGIFLPGHLSHRWIVETWKGLYVMRWSALILSLILPALLLFLYLKFRQESRINRQQYFLATAFAVALVLAKHDALGLSVQPLHFNRGYPWLALTLFAIPALPNAIEWFKKKNWILGLTIILIALSDNIGFFFSEYASRSKAMPYAMAVHIDPDVKSLYEFADSHSLNGRLLTDDLLSSYAAASYTSFHPYIGHSYLTPDQRTRVERWYEFRDGKNPSLVDSVDYLILNDTFSLDRSALQLVERNNDNALFEHVQ